MDDYKRQVEVEEEIISDIDGYGDDDFSVPLGDLIDRLIEARNEIPRDLRDTAVARFWSYGDYAHVHFGVKYWRDPTPEEIEEWAAYERHSREDEERRERATYHRRRAKYGR